MREPQWRQLLRRLWRGCAVRGTQLHTVRCLEENNADFLLYNWMKLPRRPAYPIRQR